MRKIFIDGGAHVGESIKYFYEHFADAKITSITHLSRTLMFGMN